MIDLCDFSLSDLEVSVRSLKIEYWRHKSVNYALTSHISGKSCNITETVTSLVLAYQNSQHFTFGKCSGKLCVSLDPFAYKSCRRLYCRVRYIAERIRKC